MMPERIRKEREDCMPLELADSPPQLKRNQTRLLNQLTIRSKRHGCPEFHRFKISRGRMIIEQSCSICRSALQRIPNQALFPPPVERTGGPPHGRCSGSSFSVPYGSEPVSWGRVAQIEICSQEQCAIAYLTPANNVPANFLDQDHIYFPSRNCRFTGNTSPLIP